MLRTGIETIICLSPNFLYVYVYVHFQGQKVKGQGHRGGVYCGAIPHSLFCNVFGFCRPMFTTLNRYNRK